MQISAKIMLKVSTRTIFNGETLPWEMVYEHTGRLSLELIKEGPPHLYTGNKVKKNFERIKYTLNSPFSLDNIILSTSDSNCCKGVRNLHCICNNVANGNDRVYKHLKCYLLISQIHYMIQNTFFLPDLKSVDQNL